MVTRTVPLTGKGDDDMNLTERTIRDAQPGPKQRFVWDAQVKGLGVRITPAGSKAYVLDYRIHGRRRRGVLARVSDVSLREARQRAGVELARIRAGESDPLTRRQEAREAPTVNDGIDRFFGEYAPARIATGRLRGRRGGCRGTGRAASSPRYHGRGRTNRACSGRCSTRRRRTSPVPTSRTCFASW